jgi:hypothetical protein
MNIVILDDYQDSVRKLACAAKLDAYPAKVYTNTVKGIGQLSVRLKDADVIVLLLKNFPDSNWWSRLGVLARTWTLPHALSAELQLPRAWGHR